MTLPAITIRPPWSQIIAETAALVALDVDPKTVENRGRAIADKHIGRDIGIHAGLTWCKVGEHDPRVREAWKAFAAGIGCCRDTPHPALARIGDTRSGCVGHPPVPQSGLWMEQGAIVAVATLVDCHEAQQVVAVPDATCCWPWGERYHNGKPAWHLVLDNVRRLRTPVSAKGSLAMPWTVPAEIEAQVLAQLPAGVA
jgi:hypothetical protein